MLNGYQERAVKNYFPMPKEIFSLGLKPGELAVYSYLMYCENRKTFTAYPSYSTIGSATRMSPNTVRKYVNALVDKGLVTTEPTTVPSAEGWPRNGTLLYNLRPLREAVNRYHELELARAELDQEKNKAAQRLKEFALSAPQESPCGNLEGTLES